MATVDPTTGLKRCGRCNISKRLTEFHRCSREKCGYQQWCKECRKAQNPEKRKQYFRDFYHNNTDKYLRSFYQRKYGISLAEYRRMEAEQGGVCYLCRSPCATGRRLAVDHDHKTGSVRALLCGNCNKAIGCFKEDAALMERAIAYLRHHAPMPTAADLEAGRM